MNQIVSIVSMLTVALIGNIVKAAIIRRSRDDNWTMFLYVVAEIALYQIVTDVNLGIISAHLTDTYKALGVSAVVLLMTVAAAGINDHGKEGRGEIDDDNQI